MISSQEKWQCIAQCISFCEGDLNICQFLWIAFIFSLSENVADRKKYSTYKRPCWFTSKKKIFGTNQTSAFFFSHGSGISPRPLQEPNQQCSRSTVVISLRLYKTLLQRSSRNQERVCIESYGNLQKRVGRLLSNAVELVF